MAVTQAFTVIAFARLLDGDQHLGLLGTPSEQGPSKPALGSFACQKVRHHECLSPCIHPQVGTSPCGASAPQLALGTRAGLGVGTINVRHDCKAGDTVTTLVCATVRPAVEVAV